MIVLNFTHPQKPSHLQQIEDQTGQVIERVLAVSRYFEVETSFVEQARALVEATGLSAVEWQSAPLLVNLPSLSVVAALVLAEIHGRSGHFPHVLRLRPVVENGITRFEFAEILSLQSTREVAMRWAREHQNG